MSHVYYVSAAGDDQAEGTLERPFRTISKAALTAVAGDKVIVREGVYREWVNPVNSGLSDICRVIYEAASGEKVIIKGSERIDNWECVDGSVWKAVISNDVFGNYNPYKEEVNGDWLMCPQDMAIHTGEVYLNGKAFYEAGTLAAVMNPVMRTVGYHPPWTGRPEQLLHPEDSIYQWYAEVDGGNTIIYANFQGANPNQELTEINVRKCCFYPERTGINYITVRGFEMAQAACPWTPPTADQPGLLGTHWSKGWIIENNLIHDAKCSGISIGKEASTGHNQCSTDHRKPGYQYQMEAVFRALQIGWSKETIGSHIIRNNVIYDCGQNGIVGHMGGAFSRILDNHIYNIGVKQEFFGYEIGGIKLHAAIDVQIIHNNFNHCSLGIWLDWQAQGVRVSRNLFYANDRDLMIEVTHGPYLIDNNIFASDYNFDNIAQGGAYVHNLCCGTMRREPVLDRSTPYHFPHTTQVAGSALVYGGDDRLYQNIFLGGTKTYTEQSKNGTSDYDGCCVSMDEYIETVLSCGRGDHEVFGRITQPAYIENNVYLNGAPAFAREKGHYFGILDPEIRITLNDEEVWLEFMAEEGMFAVPSVIIDTEKLGAPRITGCVYDGPEGNPITLDSDYLGQRRKNNPVVGPFEGLVPGSNKLRVW